MTDILVKINDEIITTDQFIKFLKFSNQFSDLMERLVRSKITVHAAKKIGIIVSTEEVQEAADNFRRCMGLHRAKDTQEWLDKLGVTDEEFENFVAEQMYRKKAIDTIVNDETIEAYFRMNAPKFDTADIRHIVVEGVEKAKELMALLEDDPDNFDEFVKEYSSDEDTRDSGGLIRGVNRGVLPTEMDAKVFHGKPGEIAGLFRIDSSEIYEIIKISDIKTPASSEEVREKISETMYDEWLAEQLKNNTVTIGN